MAAASSDVGYTFHARCGRRVKITNSSKTAERLHRLTEFNNAVVISSQPLEEGKLFEVKIDTKIATWSGSILVGATTKSPERFRFPSSISNLTSSSWVFNGESVWKDGKKISSNYGSCSLESLVEGSTVGLMRRSSCLHLYINDTDQGVADSFLPPGHVYPIVDLYGRCTRVSIIQPSVEEALRSSSEDSPATDGPLVFHRRCGQLVQVKEDGRAAFRRNAEGEFNHGVVLTSRPLKDDELFEVEIVEMVDKWAGSIEIGVTTHRPSEIQFPSTVTNMQSGTWVMSGSGIMENGDTIQDNFGRSLDSLKSGERVGVMRTQEGSLMVYINGRQVGTAATDLPPRLYGIVDLYGQCAEVKITSSTSNSSSIVDPTSLDMSTPLRFHALCGGNAQISEDRLTASRTHPYEEFTKSTAFTSRPLRPNELFQVTVEVIIDSWSGSLQFGVCKLAPDLLDFESFEEISDMAETSWVLSGTEVFHSGIALHSDYPLNLDVVPMEMVVGVMVTSGGELHFFLGDEDMGCAARDIPTGVYGVVDIYGQCAQVTIVERHENLQDDNHVITRRRPTLTPQHVLRSLPNEPLAFNPSDHAFHPKSGRNVQLTENCTIARRIHSYKDGITFSVRPLKEGATFEVELLKRAKNWQGPLRIGLTTCNPSSFSVVPQVSTQLPPKTWIVSGSSVLVNGNTVTENYGRSLNRLQTGNIIGVQRSPEGAMHVFVNGCDLGPAVFGVPESVYAVVDLYGSAQCVKVVGEKMETPVPEQLIVKPLYRPVQSNSYVLQVTDQEASGSADMGTFSTSHGPNVQLGPDRRSARRVKSYTKAIVISSAPLSNDRLFQVQIKRLNTKWSGTIMIGVTSLTPSQACMADKASDLQGQSFVLCASNGVSSLFVGGQKLQQLATDIDLLSLKEGDTIGVLCESNNTLSFYINGQCVTQVSYKVPKLRYAVVDLYGQCCEVELKPLAEGSPESKPPLSFVSAALHDIEPTSPSSVKQKLQPWKKRDKALDTPTSVSLMTIRSRQGGILGACVHHTRSDVSPAHKCHYQDLCERFVRNLAIPEPYLAVEHNKCYCESCAAQRGDPPVKYHGNPGAQMKYAVPLGWVKCALRLGPQAEVRNAFTKWHVAYHGTAVGNVRNILDCGDLMLPGDCTFGNHQVTRPDTHFNETFKPEGFDVQQIFVSPSIKYCTNGEVYAKTHLYTDPVTKMKYSAKVAFKLWIDPDSYKVSPQTVQVTSSQIDDHFSNSELEWSTKCRKAIFLCGLMVKLERSE